MNTAIFEIQGMRCDGCAERVDRLLSRETGVRDSRVSFAEASAEVRYNPHRVDAQRLRAIIEAAGFGVRERSA